MCLGWHLLPMAAIEPDECLQAIGAEIGCMTPYIDLALPTNPTLIIGMTG